MSINLNDPNIICRDHPDYAAREIDSVKDLFTLKGKKCLVTGAAGGIGRSTSKAFAELGGDVCLVDIPSKEEKLKEICAEIEEKYGVRAIYACGDVSKEEDVLAFVDYADKQFGTIDVVHSNAGIVLPGDNPDVAVSEFRRVIDINLIGMMMVSRACANIMKRDGHGGKIVHTVSQSGSIVNAGWQDGDFGYAYHTSKGGARQMTRAMALNYIKYGINVNSVSPGVVLSGIHDPYPVALMKPSVDKIPQGRFGYLQEVASVVAFLATDLANFCVGADVIVNGGEDLY